MSAKRKLVKKLMEELEAAQRKNETRGWPEFSSTEGLGELVQATTTLAELVLLLLGEETCPKCGRRPGEEHLEWCDSEEREP